MAVIRKIPGKRGDTYNIQIRIHPYENVTKTFKKLKAVKDGQRKLKWKCEKGGMD